MLTTDELGLGLGGNYAFTSSPESCSDQSFSTEYMESEEDFLTQLSSDLDIPFLLNGGDDMSMLNSFLDKSTDEILSGMTSPASSRDDDISEINYLNTVDFNWTPDVFNIPQTEIKMDKDSDKESDSSSKASSTSSSPPKVSPITKTVNIPNGRSKMLSKRVPIQPKSAPYTIPPPKPATNQVILIKNNPVIQPNVVLLENVTSLPLNNNVNCNLPKIQVAPLVVEKNQNNCNNILSINSNIDPKLLKLQQRKIKNRESACLSRKKKKDYLNSLEEKVKDLTEQNDRLKMENQQLKERLSFFEKNPKFNLINNKNLKQSLAICIVLFILGVNVDFIRGPFGSRKSEIVIPKMSDHHSRSLLWTPENEKEDVNNKSSTFFPFSMCPLAINQTESARLVLELERFIGKPPVNSMKNLTRLTRLQNLKRKRALSKNLMHSKSSKWRNSRVHDKIASTVPSNELQVFQPSNEPLYSEFFEAINRQDDTFYVVSFSDHHMLLPALHHNKTRRPKMSLIMPSVLPNDTTSNLKVQLMQIDCEVLDTRLLHINYGTIPIHLRNQGNTTVSGNNNEQAQKTGDTEKNENISNNTRHYRKRRYKP